MKQARISTKRGWKSSTSRGWPCWCLSTASRAEPGGRIRDVQCGVADARAAGYRLVDGQLKNQEWVSPTLNTTADGSLYFSILDLAKWDAALYTEKMPPKSRLEQMWTVATLRDGKPNSGNYGYGCFIGLKKGHRVVEHEGEWQGFETQISRYVDDGLTVVVLTNLAEAKPEQIADGVAAIYWKQ